MKNLERRDFVKMGLAGTGTLLTGLGRVSAGGWPVSKEKIFNIRDFGAVGDGKKLNTAALQRAIDTCSKQGGGRLVVPKGNFLTGTFFLKSNVNLHLEEGGIILGSPFLKDYPQLYTSTDLQRKYPFQTLVCSESQQKVMISGPGTINGNAQTDSTGDFRDTGNNDLRPCLFRFVNCTDVTIKEITFQQSLMWTAIFDNCRHLWIDKVTIRENYFYNADGIDIVDCEDFLVENCVIDTDDDGICLKSAAAKGCVRGVVRNNKIRSLCNAIKMGTGSAGGFRNILIENNEIWQTVISGVALQIVDGGVMDDVVVRNIVMNGVGTPISIRLGDRRRPESGQVGTLRNVRIQNITATVSKAIKYNAAEEKHHPYPPHTSSISGIPGHYIENVVIENVTITIGDGFPSGTAEDSLRDIPEVAEKYPENRMFGLLPAYGFFIRHVRNIELKNIHISSKQEDGRPVFVLDDVHDARFSDLKVTSPKPTPLLSTKPGCSRISFL